MPFKLLLCSQVKQYGQSMIIGLPFEILLSIIEQVDDVQDLRRIRTTSRALCAAATPIAFRAHSVASNGESARNSGQLLDIPNLATQVPIC
jgi:hypothetical protein